MLVSRVIWKIITQNISQAMSLRDRAEVTEVVFFRRLQSMDGGRRTAVDGRQLTDGGRRFMKFIFSFLSSLPLPLFSSSLSSLPEMCLLFIL